MVQGEAYRTWGGVCVLSAPVSLNENSVSLKPKPALPPHAAPPHASYNAPLVQSRLREVLHKYSNGFWVSKLPQLYRELYKQELPVDALKELEHWSHICTVRPPPPTAPPTAALHRHVTPAANSRLRFEARFLVSLRRCSLAPLWFQYKSTVTMWSKYEVV